MNYWNHMNSLSSTKLYYIRISCTISFRSGNGRYSNNNDGRSWANNNTKISFRFVYNGIRFVFDLLIRIKHLNAQCKTKLEITIRKTFINDRSYVLFAIIFCLQFWIFSVSTVGLLIVQSSPSSSYFSIETRIFIICNEDV